MLIQPGKGFAIGTVKLQVEDFVIAVQAFRYQYRRSSMPSPLNAEAATARSWRPTCPCSCSRSSCESRSILLNT